MYCTALTNVVFDCPSLTNLEANVFKYCSALKTLVINSTNVVNIASQAEGATAATAAVYDRVIFEGPAPTTNALANLLVWQANSATGHTCVVYGSRRQPGWTKLGSHDLTDDEKENCPIDWKSRDFLGVFVTTNGERKAWILHRDLSYDGLKYFYIRVCENKLGIGYDWIEGNCGISDIDMNAVAVSNALVSAGANGMKRWESYALGLDPNDPASVVLCDARQAASSDEVTFFARNVDPRTNADLAVNFLLEGPDDGGVRWSVAATSPTNAIRLPLPSAYAQFRIRTDIILKN